MEEIRVSKLKTDFDKTVERGHRTKQTIRITWRGKKLADVFLRKITPGVKAAK